MQFSAGKHPEHMFSDPLEANFLFPAHDNNCSTDEYKADLKAAKARILELESEVRKLQGRGKTRF